MATKRQQALGAYLAFLIANPDFSLDDLAKVAGGRDPRARAPERVKYYAETGRVRLPRGMRGGVFVPRWNLMLPPSLAAEGGAGEPLA